MGLASITVVEALKLHSNLRALFVYRIRTYQSFFTVSATDCNFLGLWGKVLSRQVFEDKICLDSASWTYIVTRRRETRQARQLEQLSLANLAKIRSGLSPGRCFRHHHCVRVGQQRAAEARAALASNNQTSN